MKRNFALLFIVIILSVLLIYPLGYTLNQLIFHQQGGGFDVGIDDATVNIFIGIMTIPAFLASLLFGIWGSGRYKWIFAIILSLPFVIIFSWAGSYMLVPLVSFLFGIVVTKFIGLVTPRLKH